MCVGVGKDCVSGTNGFEGAGVVCVVGGVDWFGVGVEVWRPRA